MKNINFKQLLPHLVAVVIFLVLNVIYFSPQLEGKVMQQGDIVSSKGMSHEMQIYQEKTGERQLWTNAMFGGMPTYQIGTIRDGNQINSFIHLSRLFINGPIGMFFAMMICAYIFFILLGVNQWLSIIGAISFAFTTNNLVLFEAGHSSKIGSITYIPLILAGLIQAYRKKYLMGGVIFSLGFGLNLIANHVQMTYYFGIIVLILVVIFCYRSIIEDDTLSFFKSSGIILVAAILAIGASTSNLWTSYEYSNDTMRGSPILAQTAKDAPKSSSETEGLEWEYAMQWSNGTLDLFAALIPGVVGGSSSEEINSNSSLKKFIRGDKVGMYWGSLPFTSGPAYFGAILVFLFVLGLCLVKGNLKWWLGIAVLLTFLLSMGKHFAVLNELVYNYLPLFNKFRAPSSILSVTAFLVPILGMLVISNILLNKYTKEEVTKGLMIAGGITGGICLFFALLGSSFFEFITNQELDQLAQLANDSKKLKEYEHYQNYFNALGGERASFMSKDAWRSFFLIAISGGLLWAFMQKKLSQTALLLGLGSLITFDLWTVDKRYVDEGSFVKKREYNKNFEPRPVDKQILTDKDLSYRVLDLAVNTYNSSKSSYFHKTIGGYHAAKLQRYQDLIEYHISKGNQQVLNMLNTRYIISREQQVQRNSGALGNAWFVESIKTVNTPNEEIEALKTIITAEEAVVLDKEFDNYIAGFDPQKNGTITLKEYSPDKLVYASNSSSEQLAIFSEIWYGPNKGWQAYIDDKSVEHIRANYALRALKIPGGQHKIEFRFEPISYFVGKTISLICSILILVGLFGYIGYIVYQNNKLKVA